MSEFLSAKFSNFFGALIMAINSSQRVNFVPETVYLLILLTSIKYSSAMITSRSYDINFGIVNQTYYEEINEDSPVLYIIPIDTQNHVGIHDSYAEILSYSKKSLVLTYAELSIFPYESFNIFSGCKFEV